MLELVVNNSYKESSETGANQMLSMSMFVNKEDFLAAKADLQRQENERISAIAEPGKTVVKRLVAGIELKLVESGQHWTLGVRKK